MGTKLSNWAATAPKTNLYLKQPLTIDNPPPGASVLHQRRYARGSFDRPGRVNYNHSGSTKIWGCYYDRAYPVQPLQEEDGRRVQVRQFQVSASGLLEREILRVQARRTGVCFHL